MVLSYRRNIPQLDKKTLDGGYWAQVLPSIKHIRQDGNSNMGRLLNMRAETRTSGFDDGPLSVWTKGAGSQAQL